MSTFKKMGDKILRVEENEITLKTYEDELASLEKLKKDSYKITDDLYDEKIQNLKDVIKDIKKL